MDHYASMHPELAPHVKSIFLVLQALGAKLKWDVKIVHSYREPALQEKLFNKGREWNGKEFLVTDHRKVVTNARAHQSPHCARKDGKPASCAVDFALLRDGKYLPDDHLAWALIGGIAASNAPEGKLEWGGFWTRPRDLGHLELRDWRKYADDSSVSG